MPYIKSCDIHVTPNRSLNYICDPKKTQGGLNIVSLNCMPDPRNAYEEMKRIYEYYSRHKFNEPKPTKGKARVKLIHYIQSFDPKDNISIETAQQIALDTVREMFGENAQAVIATHDDTGKVHNHIMLNVFDLTGKRFHSCKESLKKIKEVSDEVCMRYGIQPFDRENYVRKPIISGYHEWKHIRDGTSWKQQIRDRIDELIPIAESYEDVKSRMEAEGYTFKDGKYVSVKAPGQERFARLKTIGDYYTPENITKRITAVKGEKIEKFSRSFYNLSVEIRTHAGAYSITKPIKD
ncbi:MAG: relaxase/mobilization nuclease domain-containing protein, partial [Ruminococcus sp.]|nr:relaxase/mobilization nuclease domain-containing protein [Ruminococcus sp.]